MKILKIITGSIETNTYIICNGDNSVIIDPAIYSSELKTVIEKEKIKIKYILVTHAHFDHVNGVKAIKEQFNSIVICSEKELELINTDNNMAHMSGEIFNHFTVDKFVVDNEDLCLDGINIRVLETPGHSIGGLCFIYENNIFCGDTIFRLSVGRTDLPTGSWKSIESSIKEKLFSLESNYTLLPGHGEQSTLFFEKENNPYV